MYRMPEKQSGIRKVLNCARSCFYQYANHLPNHHSFHWTEISLLFLALFDLLHFILYYMYFVQAEFFHANTLSKGKKLWGNIVFTTTAICIYFASLVNTYMQITFHLPDFPGDKNVDFQFPGCLPFIGTLFILAIKIL